MSNNDTRRPLPPHMRLALALAALAATAPVAHAARIDGRYGNDGYASSNVITDGTAMWLDGGGRVLVAGDGGGGPGVLRLTASGRHDTRFGRTGGVAVSGYNGFATPFGVRRGRVGVIRVAALGESFAPPAVLMRFGPGGARLSVREHRRALGDPGVEPLAGVQRPDGGAYVLGANGQLRAINRAAGTDTRFAGGTVQAAERIEPFGFPVALALRRNGRLLVALRDGNGNALLQYTRRGRRDRRFGTNGRASLPFAPEALEVLRNGDVVGAAGTANRLARVFRLTTRGRLRASFGAGGIAASRTARGGGAVSDIVADRRGRLFVLAYHASSTNSAVAAFRRNGTRLASFGPQGARFLPAAPSGERNLANRLLLDGRRGLLVAGSRQVYVCDDRQDLSDCGFFPDSLAVWRIRL